jgi:hypothetical protein
MTIKKYNHYLDIIVTSALILDWAPSFFVGIDSSILSGTKMIAVPLIFIDFLLNTKTYLKVNFALYFFISFLVGVGGGVLTGNVSFSWFVQLVPIIFVFYFYQKPRTFERIRIILKVCFITSMLIPFSLLLSYFGILTATATIIDEATQQNRTTVGISWSSLGITVIAISSTLAGLLTFKKSIKINLRSFLLRSFFIVFTLSSLFLTGLKSSIGAFTITFMISLLLSSSITKKNRIRFIFSIVSILFLARSFILNTFLLNLSRYENLSEETDSVAIRIEQYSYFFWHLFENHTLFPFGMENAMKGRWEYAYSHFIIGEAYFFGGIIFLIPILLAFYLSFKRSITAYKFIKYDGVQKQTILALISYLIGIALILSVMPGLHTRVAYIVLGLGVSLNINNIKKHI